MDVPNPWCPWPQRRCWGQLLLQTLGCPETTEDFCGEGVGFLFWNGWRIKGKELFEPQQTRIFLGEYSITTIFHNDDVNLCHVLGVQKTVPSSVYLSFHLDLCSECRRVLTSSAGLDCSWVERPVAMFAAFKWTSSLIWLQGISRLVSQILIDLFFCAWFYSFLCLFNYFQLVVN